MAEPELLHIDDDRLILHIVREKLTTWKIPVKSILTPLEGVRLAVSGQFPVVLLDAHMPDMDGIEILQSIKRRTTNVQVIMLTGETSQAAVDNLLKHGADDFIFKPMKDFGLLRTAVESAFTRSAVEARL